jgi:D-sedoheptulose 7-phosphate isomerase
MNLTELNKLISTINSNDLTVLLQLINESNQVILIGNGGSNAIASHIAVDYVKFLDKKSLVFSDPSMLTAYNNDYSVELAYAKYLESMADSNTLVILISSSGESKNINYAAEYCKTHNINFIILTGFNENNTIRRNFKDYAKLDYWVDSKSYGIVECIHQIFLHALIDN